MRLREELEERLRVLTQAYFFSNAHRSELSDEARVKHRILEENINLLQWCLAETDSKNINWGTVREAFNFFLQLFWQKTLGGIFSKESSEEGKSPTAG